MLLRAACVLLAASLCANAAIRKIYVEDRSDVLDGRSFGNAGPYERIIAKAHFHIDPALPANQREVIRLKFQNQMSYREISQLTRLTETNVGFLIHTAIKTLRRRFERLDSRPGPSASRPQSRP